MKVKEIIRALGILPNVKGAYYIIEAVELIQKNIREPILVTKDIYPAVALKYHTSIGCVERVIRNTIASAWIANRAEMEAIAGYPLRLRPTNKEFLFMIADYSGELPGELVLNSII